MSLALTVLEFVAGLTFGVILLAYVYYAGMIRGQLKEFAIWAQLIDTIQAPNWQSIPKLYEDPEKQKTAAQTYVAVFNMVKDIFQRDALVRRFETALDGDQLISDKEAGSAIHG
jgi:hypothetical protein